ncbi:MAG: hypothetical protein IPJ43_09130 [Saprospiraceae bacterium]|nr:hypothetical protein [Saprospiraceae bacterium]
METYKINFSASDFVDIIGYQFTLNFDRSALSYQGMENGALSVSESNFGLNKVSQGFITTSWNSNTAISVNANEDLFTLVFKANKNTTLAKVLSLSNDITQAEAYSSDLNAFQVKLNIANDEIENSEFVLFQNEPNPFKKETVVSFRLPRAMESSLTIYDQYGKVIRIYEIKGVKGINQISINKLDLNGGSNILYYQLDAADYTATKRMVLVD